MTDQADQDSAWNESNGHKLIARPAPGDLYAVFILRPCNPHGDLTWIVAISRPVEQAYAAHARSVEGSVFDMVFLAIAVVFFVLAGVFAQAGGRL